MTETMIPRTIDSLDCESKILNLINAFVNRIIPLESILFEDFYIEIQDSDFDRKDILLIAAIINEGLRIRILDLDIEMRALALQNALRIIARNR